jgi:hypothetical protein
MSAAVAPRKILVAVHGIGEQTAYETAQSVAFRVFDHYHVPPALPLGRFYREATPIQDVVTSGVVLLDDATDPVPKHLGFAEMYWADVPRKLVKDGYTLEEAKRWARTIIARLNLSAKNASRAWERSHTTPGPARMSDRQYRMLRMVLDEMVDAVFILENLTFLAAKAGLFEFKLKQLLDNFLNDVQVVTEFQDKRQTIRNRFHSSMKSIATTHAGAEIYIVGHSEGSVVAFLSLLHGLSMQPQPAWVGQVRGLMTIGSPIEIHRLLWQEDKDMWPDAPKATNEKPIQWWNYYDTGDPIAYKLECTRQWLESSGWNRHLLLPEKQDVEFGRYPLAGKAHVDYWKDGAVFSHFMGHVVEPADEKPPLPRTKRWAQAASVALPYLVVVALMFVGVFALYKPLTIVIETADEISPAGMARDLAGFTLLLIGVTMAVRTPRLTQVHVSWVVWLVAAGLLAAGLWGYRPFVDGYTPIVQEATSDRIERDLSLFGAWLGLGAGWGLGTLVAVTTLVAAVWSYLKPARGVRPLMVTGGLATVLMTVALIVRTSTQNGDSPDIWPVVLGGLFFLYLWWLATLILDLTIVWHSHVRWSAGITAMRHMMVPGYAEWAKGEKAKKGQAAVQS